MPVPNVHQSKSSDHDRLGFHPECPLCRQDRLFGVLAPEPILSRRVRVLLATGVLALCAGGTATSVASEPDNQHEGVVVPEQGAPTPGNPTTDSPDQSPDGGAEEQPGDDLGQGPSGETALPVEVDPVLSGPQDEGSPESSDDTAPPEAEPTEDLGVGLPLTDPDAPDSFDADDPPLPPTEAAPPIVPAPAPPLDKDGRAQPPEAAPPALKPEQVGSQRDKGDPDNGPRRRERHSSTTTTAPAPSAPTDAPTLGAGEQVQPEPAVAPATPPRGIRRFHVVRSGESLWSIASELLGPGASAAAVALEVHRLWELNEERIATGDPDLLTIGVKLRLR